MTDRLIIKEKDLHYKINVELCLLMTSTHLRSRFTDTIMNIELAKQASLLVQKGKIFAAVSMKV